MGTAQEMGYTVPLVRSKMGTAQENGPPVPLGSFESGYNTRKDTSLCPQLVLIRVPYKKMYRSVPTVLVSEGTALE